MQEEVQMGGAPCKGGDHSHRSNTLGFGRQPHMVLAWESRPRTIGAHLDELQLGMKIDVASQS